MIIMEIMVNTAENLYGGTVVVGFTNTDLRLVIGLGTKLIPALTILTYVYSYNYLVFILSCYNGCTCCAFIVSPFEHVQIKYIYKKLYSQQPFHCEK